MTRDPSMPFLDRVDIELSGLKEQAGSGEKRLQEWQRLQGLKKGLEDGSGHRRLTSVE